MGGGDGVGVKADEISFRCRPEDGKGGASSHLGPILRPCNARQFVSLPASGDLEGGVGGSGNDFEKPEVAWPFWKEPPFVEAVWVGPGRISMMSGQNPRDCLE